MIGDLELPSDYILQMGFTFQTLNLQKYYLIQYIYMEAGLKLMDFLKND